MNTKPANQATTVLIRKDRHGNAYMAHDAKDDLTDGATLVYSGRHAEGLANVLKAIDVAVEAIETGHPSLALRLLRGIQACRK